MSILKWAARPLALCALLSLPSAARADEAAALKGTGYRAELLRTVAYKGGAVWKLFDAIPEEKLAYRPAEDVKSIGELFVHIAMSPHFIGSLLGGPKPDSSAAKKDQFKALMAHAKSLKTKAEIGAELKKGYDRTVELINTTSDDELEKTVMPPWKLEMSKRAVLGLLLTHLVEHMGQLTAYARVNGIVPPWVAEAKKKAAEKKAAEATEKK
jgi:uncharacterized damage-inducible protein DinB